MIQTVSTEKIIMLKNSTASTSADIHRSFWLDDVLRHESNHVDALQGDHRFDFCVVGGGYSGLWTAIRIRELEPGATVAIVEADICGGGSSGRNSGMMLGQWTKIETLIALYGVDDAVAIARMFDAAAADTIEFCARHDVEIDHRPSGWLWGLTHPDQIRPWETIQSRLDQLGISIFDPVSLDGVAAYLGKGHRLHGGAIDRTAGTLHPGKLARGLRRVAASKGVAIFENSPMRRLDRERPARVYTSNGSITAKKVILTLGAWSAAVPRLSSSIFVISSDDAMSAPMSEQLAEIGYADGPLYGDTQIMIGGFRVTADGRFNAGIGGGFIPLGALGENRVSGPSNRIADIRQTIERALPALTNVPFISSWSGPIDRTRSGLPIVTNLPGRDDILVGYGLSGNGLTGTPVVGRMLASMALDLTDEWGMRDWFRSYDPWLPPEPARYIGAHIVRSAIRKTDRLSHAAEKADPITRAIAALAPGGVATSRPVARQPRQ